MQDDRTRTAWSRARLGFVALLVAGMLVVTAGIGLAARQLVRAGAERWRPAHVFIADGDVVKWTNPDDRRHNVVAYGGGWRFNEMLRPGESARRVFEARDDGFPYRFRCTLHSALVDGLCEGMCGLIHVST